MYIGKAEEVKETLLVTDKDGLSKVKEYLNSLSDIHVNIKDNTGLNIKMKSLGKICNMGEIIREEYVTIQIKKNSRSSEDILNSRKKGDLIEEKDSDDEYRNIKKKIINQESIDVNTENERTREESFNRNKRRQRPEDISLQVNSAVYSELSIRDSWFTSNLRCLKGILLFFYYLLILCGIGLIIHFVYVSTLFDILSSIYSIFAVSIISLCLFAGVFCLYQVQIKGDNDTNSTILNYLLYTLLAFTAITYVYVSYFMKGNEYFLLVNDAYFYHIYISLFALESVILYLTLKYNRAYIEFYFMRPLVEPLIDNGNNNANNAN
ncbi:MAG: hypothetical protein MJ252_12735 [archaeon]|nr:hypothetical protein [archaeon]